MLHRGPLILLGILSYVYTNAQEDYSSLIHLYSLASFEKKARRANGDFDHQSSKSLSSLFKQETPLKQKTAIGFASAKRISAFKRIADQFLQNKQGSASTTSGNIPSLYTFSTSSKFLQSELPDETCAFENVEENKSGVTVRTSDLRKTPKPVSILFRVRHSF